MTDQPTPTPRTDLHSVHWVQQGGSQSTEVVPAYFARELERELAAERALADRLAEVPRLYDADTLAGETMQWVPEHDKALAAWKAARNEAVDPP